MQTRAVTAPAIKRAFDRRSDAWTSILKSADIPLDLLFWNVFAYQLLWIASVQPE